MLRRVLKFGNVPVKSEVRVSEVLTVRIVTNLLKREIMGCCALNWFLRYQQSFGMTY